MRGEEEELQICYPLSSPFMQKRVNGKDVDRSTQAWSFKQDETFNDRKITLT